MNIVVREADMSDTDAICRLLMLLFEQEADFASDYERQTRGVMRIISNPEIGKFFVIEKADRIVGTASLLFSVSTALGGKVAMLEDFIIHPDNRREGLGRLLIGKIISYAKASGCLRLTVMTDNDNTTAQGLYQKAGFKLSKMIPLRLVF